MAIISSLQCPLHKIIILVHENVNDIGILISEMGCGYVSRLLRYISLMIHRSSDADCGFENEQAQPFDIPSS